MENEGSATASSDFGALLRRHRLAAGLSQQTLAERARMSVNGISALERGYRRNPQFETLTLLAGALALSEEQHREFVAAAQLRAVRVEGSVTVGPWPGIGPASLPLALTRFIGREAELDEIAALLDEHRFVTLTGAGGVGKTQTALRAVTGLSDPTESAVCFVGLAPINDLSLVATAIAAVLGVQEVANHPLLETLAAFLKNKRVLLVLDNCEHVISGAATVADFLLRACPSLRIMATSREPLRAAAERTYRLPSLADNDAVKLFADRAQAADAHFTLTDKNRATVGEICRHLSGIPLAIELAAARVTILPLRALAKALDDRFQTSAGSDRSAPPRQQAMRATIDWSYDLLSTLEKRLFERLSVFAGGCTIDAATAVCQGEGLAADDVLPLISSLVSKSLVLVDLERDEQRYRLLEPFREYAREKLKAHGEEALVLRRHVLAYLKLAGRFSRREQHYKVYYAHGRDEIGNWRAAIQWALTERNDVLAGQQLIAEVVWLWGTNATLSDARRWIPAALDLVDEGTPRDVTAKLKLAETQLAILLDKRKGLASAQQAIAYYREASDQLCLLTAQANAGNALFNLRRIDEARAIIEEALHIARKLGHRYHILSVLRQLGACLDRSDTVASRACLTEALELIKATDSQVEFDLIALDFADLAGGEGDYESAIRHLTDLFARGPDRDTPRHVIVFAQINIAGYLIALRRYEEAREYALEALGASREEHFDAYATRALGHLAAIAALRATSHKLEVHARAARILGFVDARLRELGFVAIDDREPAFAALYAVLGKDPVATLIAEGAALTEDAAVELATGLNVPIFAI